jgi:YlmC/YmxH family sporulation protein
VSDGRRLGLVEDVELDLKTGKIDALVIPGRRSFLGFFGGSQDVVIHWGQIQKIGEDVILVQVEKFLDPTSPEKVDEEST